MRRKRIDGYTFAVIDLLTDLVVVFMALATFALIASRSPTEAGVKPQGDIVVTLYWDKGAASDVDLWIAAPDEREPIGYLNRDGRHCDLVRDDRGNLIDPSSRNMEMIVCRNAAAGEYILNAVAYGVYDNRLPIHVIAVVQNKSGDVLLQKEGDLTFQGDEMTVARFRLNDKKTVVPGSVNQLPAKLYLGN